ncbi:hypothetical protein ABID99_004940 [Mucilaginibacter sp. OAE612]|uniref:hypothetical protein n=1 Tax=Mucilaginibacter sp. OAE612 TaxID=3156444 RepID=UPI00359D7B71
MKTEEYRTILKVQQKACDFRIGTISPELPPGTGLKKVCIYNFLIAGLEIGLHVLTVCWRVKVSPGIPRAN